MLKIVMLLCLLSMIVPADLFAQEDNLTKRVTELEERLSQGWFDEVALSGVIEVEANYSDDDGSKSSDVDLTNVELGVDVALTDYLAGFILFKWEDDDDGVIIDEGGIALGHLDENGYALTIGKLYVPFGVFETNFIADPLTLEMGETREGAAVADFAIQGFYGSVYAFNGALDKAGDDDKVDSFGVKAGYLLESDNFSFDLSVGYISNITSAGGFDDALGSGSNIADQSAGATVAAIFSIADLTLIGEYMETLDSDYSATESLEPTALQFEADYGFNLAGHTSTVAVTWQKTDEAVVLDLPETRYGAALGFEIVEGLGATLEYLRNEKYDDSEEDTLTCQLALEF
jgi:hypothetical protein